MSLTRSNSNKRCEDEKKKVKDEPQGHKELKGIKEEVQVLDKGMDESESREKESKDSV